MNEDLMNPYQLGQTNKKFKTKVKPLNARQLSMVQEMDMTDEEWEERYDKEHDFDLDAKYGDEK